MQDYAFTQGFALLGKQNDEQRKTVLFDCSRHHRKRRDTSKVEEKECQRPNTKAFFLDCKYRVWISSPLPPRPEVWTYIPPLCGSFFRVFTAAEYVATPSLSVPVSLYVSLPYVYLSPGPQVLNVVMRILLLFVLIIEKR